MLYSIRRLWIVQWSQQINRMLTWDDLGSLSFQVHSFILPHLSHSLWTTRGNINNPSGLCQETCTVGRSSDKVCWTCFIMHMANCELGAFLGTEEGQIFIQRHSVEKHEERLCPWHHWSNRLSRQCCFYVQVKLQLTKQSMYLQDIIYSLNLSFIIFPFMKLYIVVVMASKYCQQKYCPCHFAWDFAEVFLCFW